MALICLHLIYICTSFTRFFSSGVIYNKENVLFFPWKNKIKLQFKDMAVHSFVQESCFFLHYVNSFESVESVFAEV